MCILPHKHIHFKHQAQSAEKPKAPNLRPISLVHKSKIYLQVKDSRWPTVDFWNAKRPTSDAGLSSFRSQKPAGLHHAAHAAHAAHVRHTATATACACFFWLISNHCFCCYQQASNRGRIFQSCANNFSWIDHTESE